MDKVFWYKVLFWVLSLIPLGLTLFLVLRGSKKRESEKKLPFTDKLFRVAGKSTQQKADGLNEDLSDQFTYIFFFAMISTVVVILWRDHFIYLGCVLGLFIIASLFILRKFLRIARERRNYVMGALGERIVGDRLMRELLPKGYFVFHDLAFQAGYESREFNLDHVVIGKTGIFVVETKTRSKPKVGDDGYKAKVYENHIEFPNWKDFQSIRQARKNANSLEEKLQAYVKNSLKIQWMVALPGWYVTSLHPEARFVQNDKNLSKVILQYDSKVLTKEEIHALTGALAEMSKDVDCTPNS